jgi:hypothetical protein
MRAHLSVRFALRFAAPALLTVGLACSSTTARIDNGTTATVRDTSTTQNPPGYRGMERDTTTVPATPQTPVDTLLRRQGTGATHDASDYTRIERDTTSAQSSRTDSAGVTAGDSTATGAAPRDPAGYDRSQQHDSTSR